MTKYIELEAAINEFNYQSQFYDAEWGNKRFAPDDVETIIRSVPAADVAPVRHGRWIKMTGMMPPEYHGHYECSLCEWHGKYNIREQDYSYCPNCGAKMEGE